MRSLKYHSTLRQGLRTDGPVGPFRTMLLENVVEEFRAAEWSIPEDFMQFSHFERVVASLDWTSSPGYPYMRRAPSNRDLFKVVEGVPNPERVAHMWGIVQMRLAARDSDPIRLFIKSEPHKLKKLEDGRYRLISSVSVVDQIIDHMLFGTFNEKVVENWPYVPSKVGWSPYLGGWRSIPFSGNWLALDKQSWDWTLQPWMIELVLEARFKLCTNVTEEWLDLATWRYKELFVNPVFITSGGFLFRQVNPGVMKSGCVNTIIDNSICQVILHHRVCQELDIIPGSIMCMGDDTLQEIPERLREYVDLMGSFCKVKDPVFKTEFAGMHFRGCRIEPSYRGKHAFVLLHADQKIFPSLADSYALLYHRSNYGNIVKRVLSLMGHSGVSDAKLDAIVDGC
uniref:Putative RNA-dependent RNA polymerase n=1 Tax=Tama virus TaxID=2170592 RepID=A0A2U3TMP6_9VIRU|nr:putative RNA-dependent RNA polymerase [Tama virus]